MPNIHTFPLVYDINGTFQYGQSTSIDLLCPDGVSPRTITTGIYKANAVPPMEVQEQGWGTEIWTKIWNCDNTAFEVVKTPYAEIMQLMEYPCEACNPVEECPPCEGGDVGSIEIRQGIASGFYANLMTANSFLATQLSNPATKVHLDITNDILYFEVPQGTTDIIGDFLIGSTASFIDKKGLITQFKQGGFVSNSGNNIFGDNIIFISGCFNDYYTTGTNSFGNNCTFGEGCFTDSLSSNSFGNNCIFANNCFTVSNGNNIFGNNCTFGIEAFNGSHGNNTFGNNCTFNTAFFGSTGVNVFGDNTIFGVQSFMNSSGNNTFGNTCSIDSESFNNSTGNNTFGNGCNFDQDCFQGSSGDNYFGNCTFGERCFLMSSGNNQLKGGQFNNECFMQSAGHNQLGDCQFLTSGFRDSTGDNLFGEVIAGDDFFHGSEGNNRILNLQAQKAPFARSKGNNIIDIVNCLDIGFESSEGNNIIGTFNGLDSCFEDSIGNNRIQDFTGNDRSFRTCQGNNYIVNGWFGLQAFEAIPNPEAIQIIDNLIDTKDFFAQASMCTFIFKANIGPSDNPDLSGTSTFFMGGTQRIIVPAWKQFSWGGSIEGDLQNAMLNGAIVHFILP